MEFDDILSRALEAARYYHPRLNGEVYTFPKPANGLTEGPEATSARENFCRIALNWLDRLAPNGEFEKGPLTIRQLRSQISRVDHVLVPPAIILAMAIYRCLEFSVGSRDVWLGTLWNDPVPV